TKQQTFQPKPFTVDVVRVRGDTVLCTFEVDLAQYISEKNHGTNAYSLVVQPKKHWGGATLMLSLATSLDTDKPPTASSTMSRAQNDNEVHDESEKSGSTAFESPPKRPSPHIIASTRTSYQTTADESPVATRSTQQCDDRHDDDVDDETSTPNSVSFAAQIIKYDRANKDLQAKLEVAVKELAAAKACADDGASWKAKHDQLAAAHGPLQDELASMKDKKAKAEKEVVLRRTELQSAMESSSRVNVVQLERIRHLTSLNEELKGKVAELTLQLTTERRATQAAAAPMLRQVSSWTEGVGPQPSVDESHLVQPAPLEASTNTVASEVVRLQAEKKTLEEKVLAMQHDVETLENQLFERSSELQHVLELHAHCNQALTAKAGEVSKAQEEIVRLQMLTASQEQRNDGNDREDAEQMVAMMQRNLDEMQDEVTQLQTKNNQLRDAKAKVETELCKRMAELKRGASWTGPTQAQMDELTQQTRHQADHIADLQTQLESMQLDLAKAKEDASSSPAQVRSVLNTHFPTQMQADAVEMVRQTTTTTKQPPSAAMDSEVGYLKQQVRELRDQKERIQDEVDLR
ncbi:hypothetical protein As57867_006868, partial [Aphanomyces stellatus]